MVATFDYDYKMEFDIIYKDDHIKIVAIIRYNREGDVVYLLENELADELGDNIDVIIYQNVDTDTEITEYVDDNEHDEKHISVVLIIIGCGLLCCCLLICFLFIKYKKRGKHCHNDKKITAHVNNSIHTITKGQCIEIMDDMTQGECSEIMDDMDANNTIHTKTKGECIDIMDDMDASNRTPL